MGTTHALGNMETYEFIELGKGLIWPNLFGELMNGKIDTSLIENYLLQHYILKDVKDPEAYAKWVAKNITKCGFKSKIRVLRPTHFIF